MRQILTITLLLIVGVAHAGNYTYQQSGEVTFSWMSSDVFNFYSVSNTVMRVKTKDVDSNNRNYASIGLVGWAFTSNVQYYSSYPYSIVYQENTIPYTVLPITYTNQTQTANNDTEHLATYDFMTAHGTTSDEALSLAYTHLGSVLRIAAYIPEDKTFSSLTLSAKDNSAWFISEATMNATNNTISATATIAKATLTLNNITVEAGDSLIAYLMTAPADLSGKSMQLSLQASDGSALQTYIAGVNIQAGKVYPVSIGRENYFKVSAARTADDDSHEEVLSLPVGLEEKKTTAQITTATAYATDFMPDTENEMKPFLLGDVNLDGTVDVTDVVIVVNHFQSETTDELDFNVADINGDGMIDVTDVVGIVNIYHRR